MENIAKLITKTYIQDDLGQFVPSTEELEILVNEKSVTRQEWADAGRLGLSAQFTLETASVNYSGQESIKYNGEMFSIYRTFKIGDKIELYLTKKGGEA